MTSTVTVLDEHKAALDERGYTVIPDVLSPERVAELRALLVERAAFEERDPSGWIRGGNQRIFNLISKGRPFRDVAEHPVAIEMMAHMLVDPDRQGEAMLAGHLDGIEFLLSSFSANITLPGCAAGVMHQDQVFVTPPWPGPMVGNVIWMIDDFTEDNGATAIIPGTHTLTEPQCWPATDSLMGEPVTVTGKAGSAFVFNGVVLHQSGANTTADQRRHAILSYYCRPFIRQQENFTRVVTPELAAELSPTLRKLLGYETYFTLGYTDGYAKDLDLVADDPRAYA